MNSRNIVVLKEVWKVYKLGEVEVAALQGVDLRVRNGEFYGIVGPSGSGKSTLLYAIGGLVKPDKGKVFIDGVEITKLSDDKLSMFRHMNIGFVFQMYHLIPRMTALKNVMLPLKLRGIASKEAEERALEALKLVGMDHRALHKPTQLSGGEQQRVAIARAIVTKPKIVLADEPTGNVDKKSALQIMELFRRLNKELGITVILVTHNLELIRFCDRVARLVDGKIAKIYEPSEYKILLKDMVKELY